MRGASAPSRGYSAQSLARQPEELRIWPAGGFQDWKTFSVVSRYSTSTFCNLKALISLPPSMETAQRAPPLRLRRPAPLPWRLLVHSFPFPSTRSGTEAPPTGLVPTYEGALRVLERAPMNIRAPTRLAVGKVRFYGQHHGEVRPQCSYTGLVGSDPNSIIDPKLIFFE